MVIVIVITSIMMLQADVWHLVSSETWKEDVDATTLPASVAEKVAEAVHDCALDAVLGYHQDPNEVCCISVCTFVCVCVLCVCFNPMRPASICQFFCRKPT